MYLRLEGNHSRIEELRPLLRRASEMAAVESSHLVIFLDSTDHAGDTSVNDYFRKPAGHFVCSGVVHDELPLSVRPLMADPTCRFLIWLSKPLLDEETEQILWVFAHEYRHFMHRMGITDANEIACSLVAIHQDEGTATRYSNLDRPEELDCELFAHEVTQKIFGAEALDSFIKRRCADQQGAAYYQRLRYLARELEASNPEFKSGRSTSAD